MLVERPDPVAAAGQVVVRNTWIGVNYVDLQHRAGQPYPVRLPLIPGTEAAGTVLAVGAGADPGLAVALGARHGFALEQVPDPVEAVLSVTGGRGADVVYDAGGRDTFEMSLDMLATQGTLVLYGQSSGPVAPFDPGRLSGITGAGRGAGSLTLRWVAASHYLGSQQDRAAAVSAILGQLTAGQLSPRIAERFPLGRASEAHARLASRTVQGKILLQA